MTDWKNQLYFGDNLDVLRRHIRDESVDLCYIDPPFNSKRNYNQIYTNSGEEDRAQAQAFIDTWTWDERAALGFCEILENEQGRFPVQVIELVKGLRNVLSEGSLLAYLVSMTLRLVEIHRVLKHTGSFYLHCDPTASHYLKILLDTIFGEKAFRNEIVWHYSGWNKKLKSSFESRHDILFFYAKKENIFPGYTLPWQSPEAYVKVRKQKISYDEENRPYVLSDAGKGKRVRRYLDEAMKAGSPIDDVWDIDKLNNSSKERLGYPTQKPEGLLERIITASSQEGDIILDAYCGCGTSVAVSQRLKRRWIGIDITYQAISVILKRLEEAFGQEILAGLCLDGIPTDMASAIALAHKKDDRVRKEFEKWAVLTYSHNRAIINHKKGADQGIDGTTYFMVNKTENDKIIFQVKSGIVGEKDIRDFRGTMAQAHAPLGVFITLQDPTKPMQNAARAAGIYRHTLIGRDYPAIKIVTVRDMIEHKVRLDMPLLREVLRSAEPQCEDTQILLGVS